MAVAHGEDSGLAGVADGVDDRDVPALERLEIVGELHKDFALGVAGGFVPRIHRAAVATHHHATCDAEHDAFRVVAVDGEDVLDGVGI